MAEQDGNKDRSTAVHSVEWYEGWDAFMEGKGMNENPYPLKTQAKFHTRWELGWKAASYQNAKK